MKALPKNAKGFVDGILKHIESSGKVRSNEKKVKNLLTKISRDEASGAIAMVESAVILTTKEIETLKVKIEKLLGHSVEVKTSVKPSLLGGLRITVGDWIFDDTLLVQLKNIQSMLI
ncbi:F0F1 ATP synthase subunit delta [Patescibacteria group bacterium]